MCRGDCKGNCSDKNNCNDKFYVLDKIELNMFSKYFERLTPKGRPQSLVVPNPSNEITLESLLQEMFDRKSAFIPKDANACSISDFSGDTQHSRKIEGVEKMYAVYAVQFYQFNS